MDVVFPGNHLLTECLGTENHHFLVFHHVYLKIDFYYNCVILFPFFHLIIITYFLTYSCMDIFQISMF